MDSRRNFIGKVASGLAGTLATGPVRALGASERIRIGIIGAGDRGMELIPQIRASRQAEVGAIADIARPRFDRAKALAPEAAIHDDFRRILDDRSIDAVIIATPPHLHCTQFCEALEAGKHVYVEKLMAFSVEHAKRMRSAYQASGGRLAVQVGHQGCSSGHMSDVRQFLKDPERMGTITAMNMQAHRTSPRNKPQWSRPPLWTASMTPDSVAWNEFLGEAPARPFDAHRLIHWRYFWDYSGGSVFEGLSQQLSFWNAALGLQIPYSASMDGGNYLWRDGREVPDTAAVTFDQPEQMLITWMSGSGNAQLGTTEDVLGTHGTISRGSQVRYAPQKMNRPADTETVGRSAGAPHAHMDNFLESIRGNARLNAGFDVGFKVSIACRMAVDSYRAGRRVYWDSVKEEIV